MRVIQSAANQHLPRFNCACRTPLDFFQAIQVKMALVESASTCAAWETSAAAPAIMVIVRLAGAPLSPCLNHGVRSNRAAGPVGAPASEVNKGHFDLSADVFVPICACEMHSQLCKRQ